VVVKLPNRYPAPPGVLALILLLILSGCRPSDSDPATETELLLGTTISVTVYEPAPDAVAEVFARVREIEEKMSTSEDDYDTTELLQVNRMADEAPVAVSEDTFFVIEAAKDYSELSFGAFDLSIWPLVRLWGFGTADASVPPERRIEETRALVDHRKVNLDPATSSISLEKEGMGIDVGGIAKGYAADEARRILSENGVERALLDFGGNILTIGDKPDGSPWRIGIQNPDSRRGQFLGIVETGPGAVVTSGDYERFFEVDGVRYHHIIDPKTGYPTRNGLRSVTILAEDSIDADALSTAVFVLGVEEGTKLIETLPTVEAAFVTEDTVYLTSGMTINVMDDSYEVIRSPAGS
jgi:FAD:protein FMN transferase